MATNSTLLRIMSYITKVVLTSIYYSYQERTSVIKHSVCSLLHTP